MTHQDIHATTLDPRLAALHDTYVEAVNHAVAENRMDLVEALAAEFDHEVHALELQAA